MSYINSHVEQLERQIESLRSQLCGPRTALDTDLAWNPHASWPVQLGKLAVVSSKMRELQRQLRGGGGGEGGGSGVHGSRGHSGASGGAGGADGAMLQHVTLFPCAAFADPTAIPVLLRTKLLPAMEARAAELERVAAEGGVATTRARGVEALKATALATAAAEGGSTAGRKRRRAGGSGGSNAAADEEQGKLGAGEAVAKQLEREGLWRHVEGYNTFVEGLHESFDDNGRALLKRLKASVPLPSSATAAATAAAAAAAATTS